MGLRGGKIAWIYSKRKDRMYRATTKGRKVFRPIFI